MNKFSILFVAIAAVGLSACGQEKADKERVEVVYKDTSNVCKASDKQRLDSYLRDNFVGQLDTDFFHRLVDKKVENRNSLLGMVRCITQDVYLLRLSQYDAIEQESGLEYGHEPSSADTQSAEWKEHRADTLEELKFKILLTQTYM